MVVRDLYRVYFDPQTAQFVLDESRLYKLEEISEYKATNNKYICDDDKFFEDRGSALQAIRNLNQSIDQGELKTCKDCGRRFWLEANELWWFECRKLFPPKRCQHCRKLKKKKEG